MPSFSAVNNTAAVRDATCGICVEVWHRNPKELVPCQHVFCERCLRRMRHAGGAAAKKCPVCRASYTETRDPNRILLNQAKEIMVSCDNCTWVGTREQSFTHELNCSGDPEGSAAARVAHAAMEAEQKAAAATASQGGSKGAFAGVFDFIFGRSGGAAGTATPTTAQPAQPASEVAPQPQQQQLRPPDPFPAAAAAAAPSAGNPYRDMVQAPYQQQNQQQQQQPAASTSQPVWNQNNNNNNYNNNSIAADLFGRSNANGPCNNNNNNNSRAAASTSTSARHQPSAGPTSTSELHEIQQRLMNEFRALEPTVVVAVLSAFDNNPRAARDALAAMNAEATVAALDAGTYNSNNNNNNNSNTNHDQSNSVHNRNSNATHQPPDPFAAAAAAARSQPPQASQPSHPPVAAPSARPTAPPQPVPQQHQQQPLFAEEVHRPDPLFSSTSGSQARIMTGTINGNMAALESQFGISDTSPASTVPSRSAASLASSSTLFGSTNNNPFASAQDRLPPPLVPGAGAAVITTLRGASTGVAGPDSLFQPRSTGVVAPSLDALLNQFGGGAGIGPAAPVAVAAVRMDLGAPSSSSSLSGLGSAGRIGGVSASPGKKAEVDFDTLLAQYEMKAEPKPKSPATSRETSVPAPAAATAPTPADAKKHEEPAPHDATANKPVVFQLGAAAAASSSAAPAPAPQAPAPAPAPASQQQPRPDSLFGGSSAGQADPLFGGGGNGGGGGGDPLFGGFGRAAAPLPKPQDKDDSFDNLLDKFM